MILTAGTARWLALGIMLAVALAFGRAAAEEAGKDEGDRGKNEVVDRNQDPHGTHTGEVHNSGTIDQGWHGEKEKKAKDKGRPEDAGKDQGEAKDKDHKGGEDGSKPENDKCKCGKDDCAGCKDRGKCDKQGKGCGKGKGKGHDAKAKDKDKAEEDDDKGQEGKRPERDPKEDKGNADRDEDGAKKG